jgi:hypothetical protein
MNGNRHFFKIFQFQFPFAFVYFFFGIAIPIPILILELGFHESTTELGQLLISGKKTREAEIRTSIFLNRTGFSDSAS